jgi:glucosamine--fructose-6-phosphate aminotransferase (isomerizing)
MCGIVGYVGKQKASAILLEGLKRLEYRGYDSAGLAVEHDHKFIIAKKVGRVETLAKLAAQQRLSGSTGISHTRWATHGGVTDANAHPHVSSDGRFAIVHNGVIENHGGMRRFLVGKGYAFASETDTEALVNLIAYHYQKEPVRPDASRGPLHRTSRRNCRRTQGLAVDPRGRRRRVYARQ